MNINFLLIVVSSVVAMVIFAFMRNKQAGHNDERRERLEQKQEELMNLLQKNISPTENSRQDES